MSQEFDVSEFSPVNPEENNSELSVEMPKSVVKRKLPSDTEKSAEQIGSKVAKIGANSVESSDAEVSASVKNPEKLRNPKLVDATTNTDSAPPITITTFQISVDYPNGIDIFPVNGKPNTYSISLRILKNQKNPYITHEEIVNSGVALFENLGKVSSKGVTLSLEELARNQGVDFLTQQLFKVATEQKVNLFDGGKKVSVASDGGRAETVEYMTQNNSQRLLLDAAEQGRICGKFHCEVESTDDEMTARGIEKQILGFSKPNFSNMETLTQNTANLRQPTLAATSAPANLGHINLPPGTQQISMPSLGQFPINTSMLPKSRELTTNFTSSPSLSQYQVPSHILQRNSLAQIQAQHEQAVAFHNQRKEIEQQIKELSEKSVNSLVRLSNPAMLAQQAGQNKVPGLNKNLSTHLSILTPVSSPFKHLASPFIKSGGFQTNQIKSHPMNLVSNRNGNQPVNQLGAYTGNQARAQPPISVSTPTSIFRGASWQHRIATAAAASSRDQNKEILGIDGSGREKNCEFRKILNRPESIPKPNVAIVSESLNKESFTKEQLNSQIDREPMSEREIKDSRQNALPRNFLQNPNGPPKRALSIPAVLNAHTSKLLVPNKMAINPVKTNHVKLPNPSLQLPKPLIHQLNPLQQNSTLPMHNHSLVPVQCNSCGVVFQDHETLAYHLTKKGCGARSALQMSGSGTLKKAGSDSGDLMKSGWKMK